jgi:hypothetical protein
LSDQSIANTNNCPLSSLKKSRLTPEPAVSDKSSNYSSSRQGYASACCYLLGARIARARRSRGRAGREYLNFAIYCYQPDRFNTRVLRAFHSDRPLQHYWLGSQNTAVVFTLAVAAYGIILDARRLSRHRIVGYNVDAGAYKAGIGPFDRH